MRLLCAILLVFSLSACDVLRREAGYPGGNLGYVADRHTLFAKGHKQRVNRYILTLALVAPLVAETSRTASQAKLSSLRIEELYVNITRLRTAYGKCALPTGEFRNQKDPKRVDVLIQDSNCDAKALTEDGDSALNFEALSFEVSKSLADALKQAFDNLEIKANVTRILALDPSEMFRAILNARRVVPVLIEYLAIYRDVTVIYGQSVLSSCENPVPACSDVTHSFAQLLDRIREPDADIASKQFPIRNVYKTANKAIGEGLDWEFKEWQVVALLQNVNRACRKLEALARVDQQSYDGCSIPWDTVVTSTDTASNERKKDSQARVETGNKRVRSAVNDLIDTFE